MQLKSTNWFGRTTTRFLDRNRIVQVVVHEGLGWWQCRFYLCVILRDEQQLAVLFPVHAVIIEIQWSELIIKFLSIVF